MDNRNVRNLIVLVMSFAIPCALFSLIIGSSRADLLLHVPTALMITLAFCVLYLIGFVWARRGLGLSLSDAFICRPSLQAHSQLLGAAATGSALILTGLVVSAQSFRFNGGVEITTLLKLVIQPLFALCMMLLFRMDHNDLRNITVINAIPGGFFGLVFGKGFNATPEIASSGLKVPGSLPHLRHPERSAEDPQSKDL